MPREHTAAVKILIAGLERIARDCPGCRGRWRGHYDDCPSYIAGEALEEFEYAEDLAGRQCCTPAQTGGQGASASS